MTRYHLEQKFRKAEVDERGGFLRVSATHPVDLFVGTEEARRTLLLICDRQPPDAPPLEVISVHRRKRDDGKWALLVRLERRDMAALFSYLVEDLVLAAERETDCHRASGLLIERLMHWQRLLSRGRTGVLGNAELRGLVGELLFLRDCAIPTVGPQVGVSAWIGPFDAPRDFRFAELDVEVKTLARDARSIRISSAEQLDPGGAPIILAAIVLENSTEESGQATSVSAIVSKVRDCCEPDSEALSGLSQRLSAAGYSDLPEYETIFFVSRPPVFYGCSETFPRITLATLPDGVVECSYGISIASIAPFIISDWRQAQ